MIFCIDKFGKKMVEIPSFLLRKYGKYRLNRPDYGYLYGAGSDTGKIVNRKNIRKKGDFASKRMRVNSVN